MSTPVTAEEVMPGTEVWDGTHLCRVTGKTVNEATGQIYISWTENLCGHEASLGGNFLPNEHFGEVAAI